MSLQSFLGRLDAAGFDADVEQLLDAFWLASLGRELSLHTPAAAQAPEREPAALAPPPRRPAATSPPAGARLPSAGAADRRPAQAPLSLRGDSSLRRVFPDITDDASDALGRTASAVVLPAPRALSQRLALMRALRPLARRWPSSQYPEFDEEGTVDSCARLGLSRADLVLPVFRPRRERWFDVELVVEDDVSTPLWADMLREFADMLRETGAFGRVRQWWLRAGENPRVMHLENGQGLRAPVASLQGKAARRLVIFASNGASERWVDGSYARVLVPWLRDNCTLLLQLSPADRWARSGLGEPQGTVATASAGALPIALDVHAHWWRMEAEDAAEGDARPVDPLPLPVAELNPAGLARWAGMQMARGRRNPAYLLRMPARHAGEETRRREPTAAAVAQAVSLLKYEFPEAFRLAVYLCMSPFTLAVARLVQAVKFEGSTNPALLDELLRSGLVVASRPNAGARLRLDGAAAWYAVQPGARGLLLRSLRERDAQEIAHELQRHVSRQIARFVDTGVHSAQLIADEKGRHRLPAWAQPFADVATSLLGLPASLRDAQRQVRDFLRVVPDHVARDVVAVAAAGDRPGPDRVSAQAWQALLAARLVHRRDGSAWAFAPYARDLLAAALRDALSPDEAADWLEGALALLQSMALAFHVSGITAQEEGRTSIRDMFPEWPAERRARLAHWMYMSEYVFWGPVRELLFTGEDPIRRQPTQEDRALFAQALDSGAQWAGGGRESWRWRSGLRRLWNAVRLLQEFDPRALERIAAPAMRVRLREFMATPVDDLIEDGYGLDKRTALFEWLAHPDVGLALEPYGRLFYERFAADGLSELAFSTDYADYVDRLLLFWREATEAVFERIPAPSNALLQMMFAVSPQAVALASAHHPGHDIFTLPADRSTDPDRGEVREVRWTVSRDGYLALIDDLGGIVKAALARRLSQPPRRPRVLWVDDRPDNTASQRERLLAGGKLAYMLATTTEQGLACAREALFDVVISDMGRPGDPRAGYTLLDALRRDGNHVPFVIFAADRRLVHVAEALRHGALGTTDRNDELSALVLRAVGRTDQVLDVAVDAQALRRYTEWKFPGLGVAESWNSRAAADLDRDRFPTLLAVDAAVDRAHDAVEAYAAERPGLFTTGTDRVTKSLGFVDLDFRERHAFTAETRAAFERHARLVGR